MPSLLVVDEQDTYEFVAKIGFERITFLRPRHDANALVVEFAPEVGIEDLELIDIAHLSQIDFHAKIVGALVVFVVDVEIAELLLADKNLGQIVLARLRHHADARITEQLLQIGVELSDFLNVHRMSPGE